MGEMLSCFISERLYGKSTLLLCKMKLKLYFFIENILHAIKNKAYLSRSHPDSNTA